MYSSDSNKPSEPAKFANPKFVAADVQKYVLQVGFSESPAAQALRLKTADHPKSVMMGDPVEASLFHVLLPAINCRKVIEVGVFTGYTTLVMAEAIQNSTADDSPKIVALDINDDFCQIGKPYWEQAGVADTIDLRLGPALTSLQAMVDDPTQHNAFDFAFVDADKVNYQAYYELLLKLIRPNGLIALDNVLWSGRVLPTAEGTPTADTVALRTLNEFVHQDDRVVHVMLPFADGVTLLRKK